MALLVHKKIYYVNFTSYIYGVPRRELTQDEVEAFRRRALEAAESLFADAGIDGVTMRAIAKRMGCSPMTTYRYFDDREAVVASLRGAVFGRLADDLEKAAARAPEPGSRVRALRAAYIDFARREPDGYRLMFSLEPPETPHPELARAADRSFAPLRTAVAQAIETGHIEGEDPNLVAHLIWVELHGLVSLELSNKLNFGVSLATLAEASRWNR